MSQVKMGALSLAFVAAIVLPVVMCGRVQYTVEDKDGNILQCEENGKKYGFYDEMPSNKECEACFCGQVNGHLIN